MRQTSRALHQTLRARRKGTSNKPLRDMFLLLQCLESAGCCLRLYRTFSQSKQSFFPILLAMRKGFTATKKVVEVNKDVYALCW